MNFPFNLIIIPVIIIATAVISSKHVKSGLGDWYKHLHKPTWALPANLFAEIWFFLYVLTGLAILWYWNVPYPGWIKYLVGVVLLLNAYFNISWNKVFFDQHDLEKGYAIAKYLLTTAVLAAILIAFESKIAAFLMLPYIIWLAYTAKLSGGIRQLNHQHSQHKNN